MQNGIIHYGLKFGSRIANKDGKNDLQGTLGHFTRRGDNRYDRYAVR
jgi:hypothetical protein